MNATSHQVGRKARAALAAGRRFSGAHDGVVALVFALSLIPVALAAGAAIDVGRAYVVKSRLAYALDAAGLAVGSAPTTDEDELNQILQDYFEANYPEEKIGIAAVPVMEVDGNEIHLSAKADMPTTLMNLIGIHNLQVQTSAIIVKEVKQIEVAMVLDVTGSMAGSKIEALKVAAHTFIEIMFAGEDVSETLKIGVVPFASAVNIGLGMAGFVKDNPGIPDRFAGTTWRGCVESRPHPFDIEDTYVANTSPGGQFRAYSWPPHVVQNNWPPVTATRGPNKHCHIEAVLPLSDQKSDVDGVIDALTTDGQTNIPNGAFWGWAVLSPQEPFTEGADYGDDETDKIMIIMTDGENFVSTATGSYSTYGTIAEANVELNCPTNQAVCKVAEMDERTTEVCEAIKDEEIIIYTIGFDISDGSPMLALLEDCATDTSKFFNSPSSDDLEATFATIGSELMNLRIGH